MFMVAGEPESVLPDPEDGEWPRLPEAIAVDICVRVAEDKEDMDATDAPGVSGECKEDMDEPEVVVCLGLSFPVGPLPRGSLFAGGRLRAARRVLFSSSSSATRCSKACNNEGTTGKMRIGNIN